MKKFTPLISISILIIMISCARFPEDIGNGYRVDFTSKSGSDKAILDSVSTVKVFGPLLDYKFDTQFIIAAERPRDSIPECAGLPGGNFKDCEEAFKKSTFTQYWIIYKPNHEIYGPYKFPEYQTKLAEMKIPETLRFTNK